MNTLMRLEVAMNKMYKNSLYYTISVPPLHCSLYVCQRAERVTLIEYSQSEACSLTKDLN